MKSIVLGLALILSTQAFATGGFYCSTPAKEYEFYGTTGRVPGNPLVGSLHVNTSAQAQEFDRLQVVGYWNMGDTLKFAVLDDNAENLVYTVEAFRVPSEEMPKFVGSLSFQSGDAVFIECEVE